MTIGVDEAGRGAWAGPLVAAAVVLSAPITELADSKALTPDKRAKLLPIIQRDALLIGIGWVSAAFIDQFGLSAAQAQAMHRAVSSIDNPNVNQIIMDGSVNYLPDDMRVRTVVKADVSHQCVSAASIVAKELRDRYMAALDAKHPGYSLASHKGYGTAKHKSRLEELSPLAGLHRLSFQPVKALYV